MSRPARIPIPSSFNEAVQVDICELKDPQDNTKHSINSVVDGAIGFHVAAFYRRRNALILVVKSIQALDQDIRQTRALGD